ncbi:MAG: hypothetical protein HYY80_02985, partial [Chloroflexi bacterium]|nr:hypothetical protein [Chloroflexota bacterium]
MSGKQWTIFGILMAVALGLAGLGFAAMSTNPPFAVASWVPIVFFVAAGMIFAYSLSFFTHNMIYNTKREKEARRQPNDGTVLLRLLDETHQKIHLVAENTINRLRDNGWQGMDKVFEDMTGINPNEVAIALQYWALKGVAQFMSGSEITIEKDVSELAEYIKKEVGKKAVIMGVS